jgi:hypothetical protein
MERATAEIGRQFWVTSLCQAVLCNVAEEYLVLGFMVGFI